MLSLFEMVGKTFVINQFVVGSGIKFWLGMFSLLFRFYSSWQITLKIFYRYNIRCKLFKLHIDSFIILV